MNIGYKARIQFVVGALFGAVLLAAAIWFTIFGPTQFSKGSTGTLASPSVMTYTVFVPHLNGLPGQPQLPRLSTPIYGLEMNDVSDQGGLQYIRAANSTWVHITGIWWPYIEDVEGYRNWSSMPFLEQNFRNASSSGMKAIVVVRGTPAWAQKISGWECSPMVENKMAAFGNFMYDLVKRYSVPPYNVKYWELGNEPDLDHTDLNDDKKSLIGCWGDKDDPYFGGRYYAKMLKAAYPRIKQADPTAQVVVGGLLLDCDPRLALDATFGCRTEANRKPSNFLAGILEADGAPFFDGISFHAYDWYPKSGAIGAYSNPNWSSGAKTTGPSLLAKADFIQSVLIDYGISNKYVLNTEVALLCGKCTADLTEPLRINFEKTKSYLVAQVYPQAIISGLSSALWFRNMDLGSASFFFSSMFNDNITARPVYTAFSTSSAFLGNPVFERALTSEDIGDVTDVRGFSFLRQDGKHIWTVWSVVDSTKILTLPAMPAGAYNHMGVPMSVATNKQLVLTSPDNLYTYIVWDH